MSHGPPSARRSDRSRPVPTLLAAGSAPWEAEAVERLADPAQGLHLAQRCLDLADLLGAAATGVAELAVLSDRVGGLDADTVARLHRLGLRVVVVTGGPGDGPSRGRAGITREALLRMEVDLVLEPGDLPRLGDLLRDMLHRDVVHRDAAAGDTARRTGPDTLEATEEAADGVPRRPHGRLVAVWGAAGAPGRTTTAVAVAAEAAARGHRTVLVDADPYGGAVAQHLAVLDEVSGLLGAARLANAGQLDPDRLATLSRAVDPGLRVLTGLPRPGRWREVRPAAFDEVLSVARELDDLVVVDTGPGIEAGTDDPFDATPNRDATTRSALLDADAVVVVAAPDPVGLQRAARALGELADLRPPGADLVAVNRMRSTLGWDQRDVVGLLQRVAPQARLTFLPDDSATADRALVVGRALTRSGDSRLRTAVVSLTTEVLGTLGFPPAPPGPGVRRSLARVGVRR